MKKLYSKKLLACTFTFLTVLLALPGYTQFITKWQTTSSNESINIPTVGSGYNYNVNWGDGNTSTGQTGNAIHNYAIAGTYTVSITGSFPQIYFNNTGDKDKIKEISNWGNNAWISMDNAFAGCSNLNLTATDAPVLTALTDMSDMFSDCISLNPSGGAAAAMDTWNSGLVIDMRAMFKNASIFNQDLNNWNTSSVKSMYEMFRAATVFNGNISGWNTFAVTDMTSMFREASTFNQNLNNWNTTAVRDMSFMFNDASVFNQNLNNWNTASVKDMYAMFNGATAFNGDISGWNTIAVRNMGFMFREHPHLIRI